MSCRQDRMLTWILIGVFIALTTAPQLVSACPVCYGETDAKTADGITMAILMMVGVTGGVVAGIVAFFVNLKLRASRAVDQIAPIHQLN